MGARILVVDDVPTNRLLLTYLLEKAFYEVVSASSGPEALEAARSSRPDLALLDVMMPGMDGYELCRLMKADPDLAETPIVMVTTLDAATDRRLGIEAGADDFLTKPVNEAALYARLRSLLRLRSMREELRLRGATSQELGETSPGLAEVEPSSGAVVLALASPAQTARLKLEVESRLDVRLESVGDAREAFRFIEATPPEALLVDTTRLGESSADLFAAFRQLPGARTTPIVALVSGHDAAAVAAALDAGANDYLTHPVDVAELVGRLRTQLRYKAHADLLRDSVEVGLKLAVTDPLTGLRNRRYFEAHLPRMIAQARRVGAGLSMLAFDIDRFKALNDGYGHAAGDAVLRDFARRLRENTRGVDLLARTGGEEFLVAMPDATIEEGRAAAERVREAIEAPGFRAGGRELSVTVSVGVAGLRPSDDLASLVDRADAALYASKAAGRNRVTLEAA